MKILFKNARILKMDDSQLFVGDLLVDGNIISKIAEHIDEEVDEVIECDGNVIMPGFKNAHAHGAMTFVRSKADNLNLQDWLFKEIFPREAKLIPSDIYWCEKLAILEYIKGGITSAFEQYYFPLETAKAAEDLGFRVALLGTYNDITKKPDLINLYKSFNEKTNSLITYNIGIHAEYTTSKPEVDLIAEVCNELHALFFAHVSETQKEVDECFERHNCSPLEYFYNNSTYNHGGGLYHGIYLTDKDLDIIKEKDLTVVTNPGSNAKLASGICPVQKYVNNGIRVAIGTDGPASNNSLDMFKEMHLLSSMSKVLSKNPKSFTGYNILKMATVNGAKAMNLNDCDTLNVGKKADIIMIDLQNPAMQPINNIVENIVYSGSKDCVKLTMIDGNIKYRDGKFFIADEVSEIYKKVQEITERIDKEIKD